MNVQQLLELEAAGWEICSHSVTHPGLPFLPLTYADETPAAPNSAERELEMSKIGFNDLGLNVQNFVVPGSSWNDDLATLSARYYNSAASGGKYGNTLPLENRWWIRRKGVGTSHSVSDITAWIEQEINDNKWLILIFHAIIETEDLGYEPWSETKLAELATWVEDQGISVVTQQRGLELSVFSYKDLLHTPVQPCRIVDTRLAGGAIPPSGIRSYNVYGAVASQGGNPAGCPSPKGEPLSVALNVTAVPLGNGNIVAYPFGSAVPTASLVNYRSDAQNIANGATVKTCFNCTKDINIKSNYGTAHVVIDVLGYYYAKP
ncbi:MAG: hypothetical protein JSV14_13160 [Deltaproteobacteria bacterium]|nr:MAG: hypothetical protein JSV14_13160 [Deltaproteobacteria bacterium]